MSRRIRKGFLLSFLILSYVQVLSVLALEESVKLDDQDLKLSKAMQEIEGSNNGRENMKKNDAEEHLHSVFPEKAQKPKGSYGGANLVHRRPEEKSAAPALPNISVFIHLCIISVYFVSQFYPFLIV